MGDVKIGPYRVVGPLGQGGMGNVYRAVHETLGREVAIKVISDAARGEENAERRFMREGRLASNVTHPVLVRVYDVGSQDGQLYIVMELVDGVTLGELSLRTGPMHWANGFALAARVADALAALHAAEILHRDVKPANVMVNADGHVKLLDMGLARSPGSTAITVTGEFVGTLKYVAPEVLLGEPPTGAADVWSIGCLIHELLTSQSLARSDHTLGLVDEIVNVGLKPLAPVVDSVPAAVVSCVTSFVHPDASLRPTMAQARDQLVALLNELGGVSPDDVLAPGFLERCRSKPLAPPMARVTGAVPRPKPTPAQRGAPSRAGTPDAPVAPGDAGFDRTIAPRRSARTAAIRPAPPVSDASQSSSSHSIPAAPSARRAFTAFSIGAAAALVMGFAFGVRHPTPPPSPPATSASAPPSVAPAPAASVTPVPRRGPSFTELRAVYRQAIPRLQAGRDTASKTIAELRRLPGGIDLGREPAHWLRWIQLAAWLDAGAAGDPPRDRAAEPNPDGAVQEAVLRITLADLSRYQNEPSARRASVAMRSVTAYPKLGVGWLALGRVLELEGRLTEALGPYRIGLPLTTADTMEQAPRLAWAGLARALSRLPGHDLENEWPAWVRGDQSDGAWGGLFEALRDQDPEISLRLVRAAAETPGGEMAALELGRILLERGEASEALLIWQRALRYVPRSIRLSEKLIDYHLARGDIASCRELRDAKLLCDEAENVVDRCDPLVKPPYRPAMADRPLTLDLIDRIMAGDVEGATLRLGPLSRNSITRQDARMGVLGALLAAGDAGRSKEIVGMLSDGFHPDIWITASGALAHPAGRPLFDATFERALAQGADDVNRMSAIRALWLTRNSKFDEARRVLMTAGESASRKYLAMAAAELTTALLMAGEKPLSVQDVPELGRRRDLASRLIAALALANYDDAAAAAWECWSARSLEPTWGVVFLRIAAFASPGVATPERIERVHIQERYLMQGTWIVKLIEEADSLRKKRGGLLEGDRPRKVSDERVR